MKLTRILLVVLILSILSGCAALVVGGVAATGLAIHDRRSVGTVIDDRVLRVRVGDAIHDRAELDSSDKRIKISVYKGWVLLAGEVGEDRYVELAGEIAEGVDGVDRVVNELAAIERPSTGQGMRDKWISSKVKTSLVGISDIPGFDPTRVQITTARSIVYLMGMLEPEEAEAVVERARTVRGVEKVVTAFFRIEDED